MGRRHGETPPALAAGMLRWLQAAQHTPEYKRSTWSFLLPRFSAGLKLSSSKGKKIRGGCGVQKLLWHLPRGESRGQPVLQGRLHCAQGIAPCTRCHGTCWDKSREHSSVPSCMEAAKRPRGRKQGEDGLLLHAQHHPAAAHTRRAFSLAGGLLHTASATTSHALHHLLYANSPALLAAPSPPQQLHDPSPLCYGTCMSLWHPPGVLCPFLWLVQPRSEP